MPPTISIDIASGPELTRAVDAFCGTFGYQATIVNGGGVSIPNPETRNQFAKRQLAEYVKRVTRSWEKEQAAKIAAESADANSINLNIS